MHLLEALAGTLVHRHALQPPWHHTQARERSPPCAACATAAQPHPCGPITRAISWGGLATSDQRTLAAWGRKPCKLSTGPPSCGAVCCRTVDSCSGLGGNRSSPGSEQVCTSAWATSSLASSTLSAAVSTAASRLPARHLLLLHKIVPAALHNNRLVPLKVLLVRHPSPVSH